MHAYAPPSGARKTAPRIGLQLASRLTTFAPHPNDLDRYDSRIMHRIVPATLYDVTVKFDATPLDIAATFSLPVSFVARHWITSRTPSHFPIDENSLIQRSSATIFNLPLSPRSLHIQRNFTALLFKKLADLQPSPSPDTTPSPRFSTRPSRSQLERSQFIPAAPVFRHFESMSDLIHDDSDDSPQQLDEPTINPFKWSNRPTSEQCAFSDTLKHDDLTLSSDRHLVAKTCNGLYRNVRSASSLQPGRNYYMEFHVMQNVADSGICIGLSTLDLPLNKLLGSDTCSFGFHSSGHIVTSHGDWKPYGKSFFQGDTIGMLVVMPSCLSSSISPATGSLPSDSSPGSRASNQSSQTIDNSLSCTHHTRHPALPHNKLQVYFFVNGINHGVVTHPSLNRVLLDNFTGEIHPTVSLYQPSCCVVYGCCPNDWKYFPSASSLISPLQSTCQQRSRDQRASSSISSTSGSDSGLKRSPARLHIEVRADLSKPAQAQTTTCTSVLTP